MFPHECNPYDRWNKLSTWKTMTPPRMPQRWQVRVRPSSALQNKLFKRDMVLGVFTLRVTFNLYQTAGKP